MLRARVNAGELLEFKAHFQGYYQLFQNLVSTHSLALIPGGVGCSIGISNLKVALFASTMVANWDDFPGLLASEYSITHSPGVLAGAPSSKIMSRNR